MRRRLIFLQRALSSKDFYADMGVSHMNIQVREANKNSHEPYFILANSFAHN